MSPTTIAYEVSDEELRIDSIRQKETVKDRNRRYQRDSRARETAEKTAERLKRQRLYVQANKDKLALTRKLTRKANKEKAIELLGGKCSRCDGTFHPAAMDFHHRDQDKKEKSVATMWHNKWEVIVEEIIKCELLCANCHRVEHFDGEA